MQGYEGKRQEVGRIEGWFNRLSNLLGGKGRAQVSPIKLSFERNEGYSPARVQANGQSISINQRQSNASSNQQAPPPSGSLFSRTLFNYDVTRAANPKPKPTQEVSSRLIKIDEQLMIPPSLPPRTEESCREDSDDDSENIEREMPVKGVKNKLVTYQTMPTEQEEDLIHQQMAAQGLISERGVPLGPNELASDKLIIDQRFDPTMYRSLIHHLQNKNT